MPTAAELTPHLAAAMPKLAALVPWLLIWGAIVVVLSLAGSVLMVRGAARIKPRTMVPPAPPLAPACSARPSGAWRAGAASR